MNDLIIMNETKFYDPTMKTSDDNGNLKTNQPTFCDTRKVTHEIQHLKVVATTK